MNKEDVLFLQSLGVSSETHTHLELLSVVYMQVFSAEVDNYVVGCILEIKACKQPLANVLNIISKKSWRSNFTFNL